MTSPNHPTALQQRAEWAERRGELEAAAKLYLRAAEAWTVAGVRSPDPWRGDVCQRAAYRCHQKRERVMALVDFAGVIRDG